MRRDRDREPRHPVPSGRRDPLSGMRRLPLPQGGFQDRPRVQGRKELLPSRDHGDERRRGHGGVQGHPGGQEQAGGAQWRRAGIPHARGGHSWALRRGGPAPEAGERDGARPGRDRLRVRRADHRSPPLGCRGPDVRIPAPGGIGRHRNRHRARPGRDQERRLRHRHGSEGRGRGRKDRRQRNSGGREVMSGERHREIPPRVAFRASPLSPCGRPRPSCRRRSSRPSCPL